ncbi:MAG: hypothetical protein NTU58_01515 [Candidatus Nealsonbacteria bacterium]|nr:hypothetical protein [Candidatus Nealsonbacteria bacterium]
MPSLIYILLAGFVGGIMRGLVGYIKYRSSYKDIAFKKGYFSSMVAISGAVGLMAAWVTQDLGIKFLGLPTITPAIAIIIGYAGGDFIENIFKILTGKTSLYQMPTIKK